MFWDPLASKKGRDKGMHDRPETCRCHTRSKGRSFFVFMPSRELIRGNQGHPSNENTSRDFSDLNFFNTSQMPVALCCSSRTYRFEVEPISGMTLGYCEAQARAMQFNKSKPNKGVKFGVGK